MDEVILSERNKTIFLIDGYKFRFHKHLSKNYQRWTCCKNNCKSFFKLNEFNTIVEKSICHNHEKQSESLINRQKISNRLKRKALDDPVERPSKIIHRDLRENDTDTLNTYDLQLIRKNIHHARTSIMPKLPKTLTELHAALIDFNPKTNKDESFILINDETKNIIIFSCAINLKFLIMCDTIYIDGTFKSCPIQFTQLFTIHGMKNNNYIPLVFCLLLDKASTTYEASFQLIISECQKLNLCFDPKTVFADFEMAIHVAVNKVWPSTRLRGCRFHLGQAWFRQIQSLGLVNEYKNKNSEIGKYLKTFFGLSFLNPPDVNDCFTDDLISILPQDYRVERFTDYILENYISESSNYPPEMWASFTYSLARTTNGCESFHSKINAMFYSAHPNIYQFINILLNIQCETYIKIRSVHIINSRNCVKEKEKEISHQMQLFQSNTISRFEYVQCLSHKFLPI